MARHLYLHSEDLDGWLAPHNHEIPARYVALLSRLEGLSVEAGGERHELRIVLNSGKSPAYLEAQAARFGGGHLIGCIGAAYRAVGGPTHRVAPPTDDFRRLRQLLGLPERQTGVLPVPGAGEAVELVAEEGKQDEHGDLVLTLFPEPEPVAHRWRFRGGLDRHELCRRVREAIEGHRLALHAYPPHGDGGLDIVPIAFGRPLGKWTLPWIARQLFPESTLYVTHGGDSGTDLPALEEPGVLPLTATGTDVVDAVRRGDGLVVDGPAAGGPAVLRCYRALARRGFYGPLSPQVERICADFGNGV
ncbi:MAG: hypothetical protein ACK47B_24495 [Armatimonadota bacterium]